ncbi:MAG: helix-turn-helix domain-containing protein [Treponema sp.]|jgi:hypothetical protein|nr:helix-turn-helix domain-containing protein [Treponema sp.]
MRKKPINLSVKKRADLERYCSKGVHSVRLVNQAKIILALDASGGRTAERQEAIAQRLGISRQTVNNARRDFLAAENLTAFLQRETPPVPAKATGETEARIIAPACGQAPKGWTPRLPAAKCVELRCSGTMSHTAISSLLKNTA